MKKLSRILRRVAPALALSLAAALAPAAANAAYPDGTIRMIVAYAPGGGTDITARLIAPYLEKYLGGHAHIIVINHGGAGGAIGFAEIAAAPADGYTIGFINTPNVLTSPIERKTSFTWHSFDLLGNVIDDPDGFSVLAESPIKTLADLAAYAKANPGKVTVGTTGTGSDDHLAMLQFCRAAGVQMTHVPFKGAAEVRGAVQSGQIAMAAMNVGEALQALKGGTPLRQLGSMSTRRTSLAPELATFKEQGYDIVMASLRGIAAPKGLPADVRERLVQAVDKAAHDPDFQAKAAATFAPLRYLDPKQYATELGSAEATFRQLWKEKPWTEQ
jgi:tripartite-type tricarboxylate transporter receptor subunit TctC